MDIINPSFLSISFQKEKDKLHNNNINQNDSNENSPENYKLKQKRKEEDFIQLFPDSDELQEKSPSLSQRIKEEEIKCFSKMKSILLINGPKVRHNKKRHPSKKRNNSSININYFEPEKKFKEKKIEEYNHGGGSISMKKTYTRNNMSLYQSYIIHEEELSDDEDEDNYNENIAEINNNAVKNNYNNYNNSVKYFFTDYSKFGYQKYNQMYNQKLKFNKLRSSDDRYKNKTKSKLINAILNLSKNIDVYLFKSKNKINIAISPNDTVKEVKTKIISELSKKKYKLSSHSTDCYELRVLDEPDESPDLDLPPLRDHVHVSALMPQWLSFLKNSENNDNNSLSNSKNSFIESFNSELSSESYSTNKYIIPNYFEIKAGKKSIINEDKNKDKDKINRKRYEVKVFYKDIKDFKDENNIKCINIFFDENDTFKNILDDFFKRDLVFIKNENLYYFITHNSDEDFESGYNLNINILSLTPPYEFDLCYKYFHDLPHPINIYNLSVNKTKVNEKIKEVEAKNNLEQYCYQVRQIIGDAKLKGEFSEDEKRQIDNKVEEVLKLFNDDPTISKEELNDKVKEVETLFNPIMKKIYKNGEVSNEIPILGISYTGNTEEHHGLSNGIKGNGDIE